MKTPFPGADFARLVELRSVVADLEAGTCTRGAYLRSEYGLSPDASDQDLIQSIKDDAYGLTEVMWNAA